MSHIELPLCNNTIIKASPDYAHILSIVLNDNCAYNWLAENYVQMLIGTEKLNQEPMFYNFIDYSSFSNTEYNFIGNNKACPFADIYRDPYSIIDERKISILDYIKQKIQYNYYIFLFLDITQIEAYKLHIKFHCPLIYGYDDEEQVFLFADYCGLHYSKQKMSFNELEKGFKSFCKQKEIYEPFLQYGINCIQLNKIDYKPSPSRIKKILQDYLQGDEVKKIYIRFIQNDEYHYGISVLQLTRKALQAEIYNGKGEIGWRSRYAHFIDFEKAMIIRLKVLNDNNIISVVQREEILYYVEIALSYAEKIMNCYLKYKLKQAEKTISSMIDLLVGYEEIQVYYINKLINIL